ncbi:MAG: phosphatase PAP2 family protein [Ginsengibacter sp.]
MIREIRQRLKKIFTVFTLFSLEIFVLVGLFTIALAVFIIIARLVTEGKTQSFDNKALAFIAGYINNINTSVMQGFTFLGTHLFLIPANLLLTAWFLFIKKRQWYSIKVPAVALSSLLLMFLLKLTFHRDRPVSPLLQVAKGFSFPSGHALMSVTFYGLLILIVWQNVQQTWLKWTLSVFLVLLILVIGVSRIYLRVHYASDVMAGFSIGLVWLLLSLWILSKVEKYSKRNIAPTGKNRIN